MSEVLIAVTMSITTFQNVTQFSLVCFISFDVLFYTGVPIMETLNLLRQCSDEDIFSLQACFDFLLLFQQPVLQTDRVATGLPLFPVSSQMNMTGLPISPYAGSVMWTSTSQSAPVDHRSRRA